MAMRLTSAGLASVLGKGRAALASAGRAALTLSARDKRIIATYLAGPGTHKLQIGCGDQPLEGWLNANYPVSLRLSSLAAGIISLDATRPFPLPDASLDLIYSAHMIEHVPYCGGAVMLGECFRVLKPGGTIRLATPDLDFLVDLLGGAPTESQRDYVDWATQFLASGEPATPVAVVNNFLRAWGHQFIYDGHMLTQLLRSSGFTRVIFRDVHQSDQADFAAIDRPARMPADFYDLETMTLEAVKPIDGRSA